MRPNLPFLSVVSNAILKPGDLLRWKMRLVKDARLLLSLAEMRKIARLTYPLIDVPRQSSPRPKLRHGRQLALRFHLNPTLNLCTLFFAHRWFFFLVFFLSKLPQLFLSQGIGFDLCRLPEIFLFRFSAKGPALQSQRLPL